MKFSTRIEVYLSIEADTLRDAEVIGSDLANKAKVAFSAESAVARVSNVEVPCKICQKPTTYPNGYCGPCWNRNYDVLIKQGRNT